jgi:hypothetical protein
MADWSAYAGGPWDAIARKKAETAIWGEDATAPVLKFFQIAAAVQREMEM